MVKQQKKKKNLGIISGGKFGKQTMSKAIYMQIEPHSVDAN